MYVFKRPFVDKFLYQMSKIFNIIIFTASVPEYANPLLDKLDIYKLQEYISYYKNESSLYDTLMREVF